MEFIRRKCFYFPFKNQSIDQHTSVLIFSNVAYLRVSCWGRQFVGTRVAVSGRHKVAPVTSLPCSRVSDSRDENKTKTLNTFFGTVSWFSNCNIRTKTLPYPLRRETARANVSAYHYCRYPSKWLLFIRYYCY